MPSDARGPNRPAPTLLQRINPIWWLGDTERPLPVYRADGTLESGWSWWAWFKRNPCANFGSVIIGCAHQYRRVIYTTSPYSYADDGWNHAHVIPEGAWFRRPFWSFRGKRWERCIGWKTSGNFAIDWRRANSPNAEPTP